MSVTVEYTIEEAEAALKRLAADGTNSMTGAECDAAEVGLAKLRLAIQVECGPGGDHHQERLETLEETARPLVGHQVSVSTNLGGSYTGELVGVGNGTFRSIVLDDGRHLVPLALSLVETLEGTRAAT